MEAGRVGNGSPYVPSAADTAKKTRLQELGIEKVLDAATQKKALKILKTKLNKTGETVIKAKDFSQKEKGSRIGKKIKASKSGSEKNDQEKIIRESINYLELFCLYSAQKFEPKNIFKEGGDINEDVHATLDLLERVSDLHKNGQSVDQITIQTISVLVTDIFENYCENSKELKMVGSPVFQSLIQLSKLTQNEDK